MVQALTVLHVLVALAIIGLVMIQRGRGADAGAGFGGSSNTFFGARGAATFLSKSTAIAAVVFFSTSLTLAYLSDHRDNKSADIMDTPAAPKTSSDLPPVQQPAKAPSDLPQSADVPTGGPAPAK
ncbi:preprotein translocase subunit SecG [Methylolobus aquaticus]